MGAGLPVHDAADRRRIIHPLAGVQSVVLALATVVERDETEGLADTRFQSIHDVGEEGPVDGTPHPAFLHDLP